MRKRLSITRDQGRKMYNYLKSITGQEGKSSNSLNSVEDCRKAILELCFSDESQKKLLKENEYLKLQLGIQEEINNSLEDDIIALVEENEKLRTKKWWKWW